MSNKPMKRLVVGLGLLALMALVVIGSTTSALAQVPTGPFVGTSRLTCATNTANTAASGTGTTACTIYPGGSYQLVTEYFFASPAAGVASVAAGIAVDTGTQAQRLWQLHQSSVDYPRWGHAAGTHWFYLYATNVASAPAGTAGVGGITPQWTLNYYAPPRRTPVAIATNATGTSFGANTTGFGSAAAGSAQPIIYAQTAPNAPIVIVSHVIISSSATSSTAGFGSFAMESNLIWGHGQEWWRGGTVVFSAKADEVSSAAASGTGSAASPNTSGWVSTGRTLTLADNSSVQSVSTSGNRVASSGTSVPYVISATDTDGDIEKVRLQFRRPLSTTWFAVGIRAGDNNADTTNTACAGASTQEYQSNTEAYSAFPCGTPFTTTYLGTTSTGTTSSTSVNSGGGTNATAVTYQFNVVPSAAAVGTWNVYAQTHDFHGGNTGEVLIGTLTVS